MTRTIDFTSKEDCQLRQDLISSFYKLIAIIESSEFSNLYSNIMNLMSVFEATLIVNFVAAKAGIERLDILIRELELQTGMDLSEKKILFVMLAPIMDIASQLNIDEESAFLLYDRLHLRLISDNLVGWMKVILLDAENQ